MTDIQLLFQSDPLGHTKQDTEEIVKYFRNARSKFMLTGQTGKRTKEQTEELADEVAKSINLKDIIL